MCGVRGVNLTTYSQMVHCAGLRELEVIPSDVCRSKCLCVRLCVRMHVTGDMIGMFEVLHTTVHAFTAIVSIDAKVSQILRHVRTLLVHACSV